MVKIAAGGALRGEDTIELARPAEIAWHWHTWAEVATQGAEFVLRGPGCVAHLRVAAAAGTRLRVQPEQFVAAYPHEGTVGTEITATRRGVRANFRWSLD